MKKKALVIGSHVSKSLSPDIFNFWFNEHKIDAKYTYQEIKPNNFSKQINNILKDSDICGFNVTIPYKELIKNKLNILDEHSSKIGAVNCVSRIDNKWVGKNTDWYGFFNSIEHKLNAKKDTAFVIGYGGASKAIIYTLQKMGFKKIKIFNRTQHKIEHLKKNKNFSVVEYKNIVKELDGCDIVINTIPINILEGVLARNKTETLACDIVYTPKETNFLSHFIKEKRIYGISMLVHQAAPCFEDWFGIKPEINNKIFRFLSKNLNK